LDEFICRSLPGQTPSFTLPGAGRRWIVAGVLLVGSPLLMGWIIGTAGNVNAGLMVLVFSGVVGACAMLPLLKRY